MFILSSFSFNHSSHTFFLCTFLSSDSSPLSFCHFRWWLYFREPSQCFFGPSYIYLCLHLKHELVFSFWYECTETVRQFNENRCVTAIKLYTRLNSNNFLIMQISISMKKSNFVIALIPHRRHRFTKNLFRFEDFYEIFQLNIDFTSGDYILPPKHLK